MKKALLIGCGAEIGSNIVLLSMMKNFGFCIDTIVNQTINNDKFFPNLNQAHSIAARLEMAHPLKINDVQVISENKISVFGNKIDLIFKSLQDFISEEIEKKWDIIILATSKSHLQDKMLINKLEKIGDYIFGMAESKIMTNIYPALLGFDNKFIQIEKIKPNQKSFALGSCQTNGWLAQFRSILYIMHELPNFSVRRVEIDIIHPDTPTGRLGTKSFSPREQDSRNNLRPSFSQIELAMKRIIPNIDAFHSVSLRVPVEEPGYQINKTYFTGDMTEEFIVSLEDKFRNFSNKYNHIASFSDLPLGSKAYKYRESICYILPKPYLKLNQDCFNLKPKINQIITQAYVSNVYAYCFNALKTIQFIAS